MDITDRLVKIQEALKKIKTSQTIGQSNSAIYTIVDNAQLTFTGSGEKKFMFKSSDRPFPHIKMKINSYTTTGTTPSFSTVIYPYYSPTDMTGYTSSSPEAVYQDALSLSVTGSGTIQVFYSIYADTPGIISEVL